MPGRGQQHPGMRRLGLYLQFRQEMPNSCAEETQTFKRIFFQLRLKVDVNECTPANAVILLTRGKTPGAEGEVRIPFVKEQLEFQENTGGATLGVAGGAKGCLSGAGDSTPSHLWLQTLLCLPYLCPELSYCPSILFYP